MQTIRGHILEIVRESDEPLMTKLLMNRGLIELDEAKKNEFFHPSFEHLHDPYLMDGMDLAVERILRAREKKERVVVFGDYDVDGVSSTALLVRFFASIGIQVSYRLPHRIHDGYGLKKHFIDELAEKDVKLIITVDCGTRDLEVIKYAYSKGIEVIVSDHHAVPEEIPQEVIAILNPKIRESNYPFSSLSGSGVALKVASAIAMKVFPDTYEKVILEYVDFACLGTIADCMPLIGENRTIASLGLQRLESSNSSGLRKLIEGKYKEMDADIVGFHIGPRINAAGRMDSPYKALSLLLAGEDKLDSILAELEDLNTKRKTTTEHFIKHALEVVDRDKGILFYDSTDIEHGIIGLIAGRLTEAFGKPAIALKREDNKLVASCRSPEHISIVELLEECREYFVAFGGHRQAAGFTILAEKFEEFKQTIERKLTEKHGAISTKAKTLRIETNLSFSEITPDFFKTLQIFKPFGIGNPKPLFLIRDFTPVSVDYLGKDGKHLKLIESSGKFNINAFGFGEFYDELQESENISLVVEINEEVWMGRKKIVLNVRDMVV
ncbi:MAG: single-stranded-DNA-specific exonuclease RecJ [Candidatus Gracilibacteria bacterium]|nr:single-stranded-DNA-specific exonuclease RecJ [Candidatus Gracilibacteria bacterium]